MQIAILGPLELRIDGRVVPLGGPKQRALLAVLALNANEAVSRDRLIEALWGDAPPPSVHQSLDAYISRLRRVIGRELLLRRPGGYVLTVASRELDLERFESLVAAARAASAAGDIGAAIRLLRDALSLWRGPALADVLYEPFASAEAERLEERRLGALEELFEAQLELGGGSDLVPALERIVREQPLRERVLGQLMLALYRAGRHADALSILQTTRRRLAGELGLEPGPQLRELERRILRHDPSLDAPPPPNPRGERLPLRAALGVAAVVMLAAATTGFVLATHGRNAPPDPRASSNWLIGIDAHSGRLADATELASSPAAVAIGSGSIWAVDSSGDTVERIDPSTRAVVDRIPVGDEPGTVATGGGAIWVVGTLDGRVTRVDPATGRVTSAAGLGGANAAASAFGAGALWIADATDHTLVEIDPESETARRNLTLDFSPSAVAVGARTLWVAGYDSGTVEEIDPQSGVPLATIQVGGGPAALAAAGDAVWVANSLDATVSEIDTRSGSVVATIPVGSGPSAIASAAGSIWVTNTYSGTVSRIDPSRNQVVATLPVAGRPISVAAGPDSVWVGLAARGDSHRGGTLTLAAAGRVPSIDPSLQDMTALLARLAYDTLVTFQAAPGPAGLRLVPDLALAVPTPSHAGTTYAFRLRPGISYSDGRPVRARDFRRAIERLFRVDSPGASLYSAVVGAAACTQRPTVCDLSHGIVPDDATHTVVFHLNAPDPDFLFKLGVVAFSAPVPTGTPDRDVGSRAVPGTGPYRIVRSSPRELRLARNRFFREWSHAAQPDGNPDAIVWRFGASTDAAARAVERQQADWSAGLISAGLLRRLRLRHLAQLHENPTFDVQFIPLNTRLAPFDDHRVRVALNLAVDRAKIARMFGGTEATPICQPLPIGFPGYRRYCPYTVHPHADGRWRAPDLTRARRLVAASSTRGERVDVWAATNLDDIPRRLPAYVAGVLRSLGYRTKLHRIPYAAFSPAMRSTIQLSVDGDWIPDYPAPSAYIPPFFGCHGGLNRKRYVCDPQLDRRMLEASAVELQSPERAASLWTGIDHTLVDRAVWVPTVNVREVEFVSERLRNYQYHPVWGFLADQAWLR